MPEFRLLIALLCGALAVAAGARAADTTAVAAAMSAAAVALVDGASPSQRERLLQPFRDEARAEWHYTPRTRTGLALKEMTSAQRAAAQKLLAAALSDEGLAKVRAVIALEIALRELEAFPFSRDPENYAFAIFGVPDAHAAWGWRIEGHHLSLHFTVDRDRAVSTLPQFLGANPAEVPRDIPDGPRKGERVLREEEDRAFALLASLSPAQRVTAVFSDRPFGDIATRNAAKVDPLAPVGVSFAALDRAQQAQLLRIVETFARVVEPSLADQRLERVRAGGLDAIRFGWAGATTRGQPYYYRIQGPRFLIELDNSGGNHIHSVWRDFDGDWGRDVLGEHYRKAAGTRHRH
jgi:hypothetical protein